MLGQMIRMLREVDPKLVMPVGFHEPHSWRGDYYELAFEPASNITVEQVLAAAESALGNTYEGYKGGSYTMTEYSRCYLARYGEGNGEMIGPTMLTLMIAVAKAGIPIEVIEED